MMVGRVAQRVGMHVAVGQKRRVVDETALESGVARNGNATTANPSEQDRGLVVAKRLVTVAASISRDPPRQ